MKTRSHLSSNRIIHYQFPDRTKDLTARRIMPLNILETSDSRKEKIARSAAGIEGRMCKSRFLSGDENNVSQTTQIYIKEFAIWERSDREAAVLIILLACSGMIERIRSENVLRWQNELCRKREVEEPSFLGCSPSYMVGVSNKLSGDPVVCSFIMISTRLSILSSPPLSSISFPLFVLCFALFHASIIFSFISPFSFFLSLLFHSFSRVCTNDLAYFEHASYH